MTPDREPLALVCWGRVVSWEWDVFGTAVREVYADDVPGGGSGLGPIFEFRGGPALGSDLQNQIEDVRIAAGIDAAFVENELNGDGGGGHPVAADDQEPLAGFVLGAEDFPVGGLGAGELIHFRFSALYAVQGEEFALAAERALDDCRGLAVQG